MRIIHFAFAGIAIAALAAGCGSNGGNDTGFGNGDDDSGSGGGSDGGGNHDGGSYQGDSAAPDGGTHLDGSSGGDGSSGDGGGDGSIVDSSTGDTAPPCYNKCSADFSSVEDCNGNVLQTCMAGTECDAPTAMCQSACQAAIDNRQSAGCEFYATDMDQYESGLCFAAYVANTWSTNAHITVTYAGSTLNAATFGRIPSGSGPTLTYGAFNPTTGIPPGEVVILFLGGESTSMVPCPSGITTAEATGGQILQASGISNSFQITSDVPVAAYEINPYGGGSAAVTGASLLLPTSVWTKAYMATTVTPYDIYDPSMNIIAGTDGTHVTITPNVAIAGGGGLPAGAANTPYTFTLNQGQQAQFTQQADLTGSSITSDQPIGLMAGEPCMRAPHGTAYCDHGEQMIPPLGALGTSYVGVMFRPRVTGDEGIWHMVGTADGTTLTYSNAVGGPATINAGQIVDFPTSTPFVVTSQDTMHPFLLATYMSGSQWTQLSNTGGYGDADMVLSVPPSQYLSHYVFFTDPTYPETDLVVVRSPTNGVFSDVTLDCLGTLTGWTAVGQFEWTRVDLSTGNFQNVGSCSNGAHKIDSASPFGLWVWGWGTPLTTQFTANVSYGYPGGMNVQKVNNR